MNDVYEIKSFGEEEFFLYMHCDKPPNQPYREV